MIPNPLIITDISHLNPLGLYTYADYLTWQFEQTVELIKGAIAKMAAPNRKHQAISRNLTLEIGNIFKKNKTHCQFYSAPFDVRLIDKTKQNPLADKEITTVVQPDLCVICDRSKLDERGCIGAPDLIVEILSPANSKKEMQTKKNLYAENEVLEYWVVDPIHEFLFQYVLQTNGLYAPPQVYVSTDTVQSAIFEQLKIDLNEVFESEENNV